jgi:hypothetical protein
VSDSNLGAAPCWTPLIRHDYCRLAMNEGLRGRLDRAPPFAFLGCLGELALPAQLAEGERLNGLAIA